MSGTSAAQAAGRGDAGANHATGRTTGRVARRGWQVLVILGAVIALLGIGDVVGDRRRFAAAQA